MDPNAALANLRRMVNEQNECGDDLTVLDFTAHDILAQFKDLDEWITRGGFLPEAWQRSPYQVAVEGYNVARSTLAGTAYDRLLDILRELAPDASTATLIGEYGDSGEFGIEVELDDVDETELEDATNEVLNDLAATTGEDYLGRHEIDL